MKSRLFMYCLLMLIAAVMLFITGCPPASNNLPTVIKVSGPSGTISQSSSTFSWNGSDSDGTIESYEYKKDSSVWVSIGTETSYTWNDYSEGTHKFEVRAQDNKGAYSEPVEWNFTYSTGIVMVGEMVLVEGGTFMMGDEFGDLWDGCRPSHRVTLTYNFYIGKYETTFDEYDVFCEATGRSKPYDFGWGRGTLPVINVSWWDAIAYCNWLSIKNGLPKAYDNSGNLLDASGNVTTDITKVVGYRLPTEAEWEYAARGGKHHSTYKYSGSDNVDAVAWYLNNSGFKTHEVGQKLPNELGIYDMSGNVWELCSDWYGNYSSSAQTNPYNSATGSNRVNRGGYWYSDASYVRVAFRVNVSPTYAFYDLGFRICRTVP
jgi:formylglycine-generating enzyme required for sulfatase activity